MSSSGATAVTHGEAKASNHMSDPRAMVPTIAALRPITPNLPASRDCRTYRATSAIINPQNATA